MTTKLPTPIPSNPCPALPYPPNNPNVLPKNPLKMAPILHNSTTRMPYHATHRRNLSLPSLKTPMDPIPLNHHSDPSTTTTSTDHNISTHFSRLYLNHKALCFFKPSSQPPSPFDTRLPPEYAVVPTVSFVYTPATLTKSRSQRTRGAKNKVNPHCIKELEPQEQEESIKKAIVITTEEPGKNVKGYVNVSSENQEKDGAGGVRKLQQGYEVKKQALPSIAMGRGRRRSFECSPQVEMGDFFACNGVKVVSADMPPFMQIHAVDLARKTRDSLEKFTAKTLALTLKKEFDVVYGAAWHCIVGLNFGSFVTHSVGGFLYFSMDHKLFVLLFKTCVQRVH